MKIAVIGLGYVGLVTAACLSELGHEVLGVDIDQKKVNHLNEGEMPIFEPGLRELVIKNSTEGRLTFVSNFSKDLDHANIIFIAVGTPQSSNGIPDLSYVYNSLDEISKHIKSHKIIILKSTVPIGTNFAVKKHLDHKSQCNIDVVSNPEFLKEGSAVNDFMKPDRIIIGTENIQAGEIMRDLYSHFTRNGHPILVMDPTSAETVKYVSNTMLALKVAFINEVAQLCDEIGADVRRVREGIISDPRIGKQFLYPSLGFGGSCLPKDVSALIHTIQNLNLDLSLPLSIDQANKKHIQWFTKKIVDFYGGKISSKIFSLWGSAFKAGTDDIRESPAISLIENLLALGASVKIYDPVAIKNTKKYFEDSNSLSQITFATSEKHSLENTDALIVCTEWLQFRNPNFETIASSLKDKVIFDGRNIYDPEKLKLYELTHIGVGINSERIKTPLL